MRNLISFLIILFLFQSTVSFSQSITKPEEEDTFIEGFTTLYGKPTHVKDDVAFFLNDGVAVRNDPHEVLFISDRLKTFYKARLEKGGE